MHLIVGLGNPGNEYSGTRHNVGFMVLQRLAQRHGLSGHKAKFKGQLIDGQVQGKRVLLLAPMTYMNLSGQAVAEAIRFHKLDPQNDLMVIVDDIALPTGKLRLRASGGAGGHNGLKSIDQMLGTQNYPRLRFGIDAPGRIPQVDYVLGKFSPEQRDVLEPALDDACSALESWLTAGLTQTMTDFNAPR